MSEGILTDISAGIGIITLNKPWKLNAWDTPMRAEMRAVLEDWNTRSGLRAIILTGAGDRAFSAGQDLDETEKFKSGAEGAAWFHSWRAFYDSIRGLDKPCIAALNGLAAGLRLAGTVEIAGLDAPPNYCRADALLEQGRVMFPGLAGTEISRWMGHRPCLPRTRRRDHRRDDRPLLVADVARIATPARLVRLAMIFRPHGSPPDSAAIDRITGDSWDSRTSETGS
jgi:hypothetical protein